MWLPSGRHLSPIECINNNSDCTNLVLVVKIVRFSSATRPELSCTVPPRGLLTIATSLHMEREVGQRLRARYTGRPGPNLGIYGNALPVCLQPQPFSPSVSREIETGKNQPRLYLSRSASLSWCPRVCSYVCSPPYLPARHSVSLSPFLWVSLSVSLRGPLPLNVSTVGSLCATLCACLSPPPPSPPQLPFRPAKLSFCCCCSLYLSLLVCVPPRSTSLLSASLTVCLFAGLCICSSLSRSIPPPPPPSSHSLPLS